MKMRVLSLIVISMILLSACGGGSLPVQATNTSVPPTATFTPTSTSTPEPTFTPTATPTPKLPVAFGTQLPAPQLAISTDNLDQVVELARWGNGVITDVVYSPEGKFFAVASTLGVSIHSTDTLNEEVYFDSGAGINSIAYSPDGEIIATGLNDNTVILWNVSDGTLLRKFEYPKEEESNPKQEKIEVLSVSFSPDGSLLASGSTDGKVGLWQVADGSLTSTLEHHLRDVTSVVFSPDGLTVFSASKDGKVRMVNVADGKIIQTLPGQYIPHAVVSSDGKTLVTYDHPVSRYEGSLIIWDVESGKKQEPIVEGNDSVEISSIALSPDGQLLAAALEDHTAKIWSVPGGVLQYTFEDLQPRDGWYYLQEFSLAFSPDSQSLLMAGAGSIGVWDVGKSTLLKSAKIKTQGYEDIALSPDGNTLAVLEGPNVGLMQLSNGSLNSAEELMQSNGSLAFSPDGSTLLVSMFDRTARLWPLNDQGSKKTFETDKKEYIRAIAFSPDGQMLAMEEIYTGKVELRQASDGALIRSMQIGTSYGFSSLGFSPDGTILAAALNDQIRLFQVDDGKSLRLLKGGFGVSFSPDGTMLAGGDQNKSLKVWNVSDGKVLLTIKDLPDDVLSTVFSPDGTLLVVGTWDGTIEIFLVSDGTQLKSWKAHSRGVADTLFSSDGKLLISASWDGSIRVWGIKP